MRYRLFNSLQGYPLFATVIFLILVGPSSFSLAAEVRKISCMSKAGGQKYIYVEQLSAKTKACRTMYGTDGTHSKQIAWAQSKPKLCSDIANKVARRLTSSGWDCGPNTANTQEETHLKTNEQIIRFKSEDQSQPEEYKIIRSIIK